MGAHEADWDWLLGVNLRGAAATLRAFVPALVARDSGHVLTTASVAGVSVIPGNGPYNAAKHAVVSLTETLAADLEAAGSAVGATTLCVGRTATRIRESARNRAGSPAVSSAPGREPPGRVLAPEQVAATALAAMDAGLLHAFTDPADGVRVRSRVERLLADLPPLTRGA